MQPTAAAIKWKQNMRTIDQNIMRSSSSELEELRLVTWVGRSEESLRGWLGGRPQQNRVGPTILSIEKSAERSAPAHTGEGGCPDLKGHRAFPQPASSMMSLHRHAGINDPLQLKL